MQIKKTPLEIHVTYLDNKGIVIIFFGSNKTLFLNLALNFKYQPSHLKVNVTLCEQ